MRWLTRAFGGDARAPRDIDSALRSALLSVLDRDLDRAESLLSQAVRADSEAVVPYLALARLFRMRGEIGRAIRIHQNLLLRPDLDPGLRVVVLGDLAADFRQGGFLRRAIASYEEVLARDRRHLGALRAMVRLFADVREYPRSLEMARRLAKLERGPRGPAEASLLVEMAEAAQAEGRREDARRAARRALRKDRACLRGWLVLGALEAERGREKAAIAAWGRVPELDRRSGPLVYPQLEATYTSSGRPRDYHAFLRRLLNERPDDPAARLALARALAARGDVDEAIGELRRILERDPDDLAARGTLGRILLSEHRDPETTKEYAELLDVLERRGLLRTPEELE